MPTPFTQIRQMVGTEDQNCRAAVLAKALARTGRARVCGPLLAGHLGRSVKAAALERCADVSVFVSVGAVFPCAVLRVAAKDHSCIVRINTGDFALVRFGALRCGVVGRPFQAALYH